MANKYQIAHIRDCIVGRLESDWPQSLAACDALEGGLERIIDHIGAPWYIDDLFPDPASAIRLGRDCGVPTILPAAFYQLSRLKISNDRARRGAGWKAMETFDERTARWDLLSGDDLLCLMRGQSKLRNFILGFSTRFSCPQSDWKSRCRVMTRMCNISEDQSAATATDILEHFRSFETAFRKAVEEPGWDVCQECEEAVRDQLNTIREEIWRKLPEYFELGEVGRPWYVFAFVFPFCAF